jgi:hypothetical protein
MGSDNPQVQRSDKRADGYQARSIPAYPTTELGSPETSADVA